jgi:hypothetical protein
MGKKGVSEKAEKMDMLRGVKLEVKECHVTLETMARDSFRPDRRPGLKIDVENMVIQSTNAKWEVRRSFVVLMTSASCAPCWGVYSQRIGGASYRPWAISRKRRSLTKSSTLACSTSS